MGIPNISRQKLGQWVKELEDESENDETELK